MSTDFETLLRADLERAAQTAPVDADAILQSGRRVVRRRRVAGVGAVAAAAVLVAGAWQVMPRVSVREPQPAATASVFTPGVVGEATWSPAGPLEGRPASPTWDAAKISVSVARLTPDTAKATVTATYGDGTVVKRSSEFATLGGVEVQLPYGHAVRVQPDSTSWRMAYSSPHAEPDAPMTVDDGPGSIPGFRLAFTRYQTFDQGGKERANPAGYAWRQSDGTYLNSKGHLLKVIPLVVDADREDVVVDIDFGQATATGLGVSVPIAEVPGATPGYLAGGGPDSFALVFAPNDVTDVTWTTQPGATNVRQYHSAPDAQVGTIHVIKGTVPGGSYVATGLSWTDAQGQRVSTPAGRVSVAMYSGREDPTFELSSAQVKGLRTCLADGTATAADVPDGLGFRYFSVSFAGQTVNVGTAGVWAVDGTPVPACKDAYALLRQAAVAALTPSDAAALPPA